MVKCNLCAKQDEDMSLFSVNHEKRGRMKVCQECWRKLYQENSVVCDYTDSGSSCPTCG